MKNKVHIIVCFTLKFLGRFVLKYIFISLHVKEIWIKLLLKLDLPSKTKTDQKKKFHIRHNLKLFFSEKRNLTMDVMPKDTKPLPFQSLWVKASIR